MITQSYIKGKSHAIETPEFGPPRFLSGLPIGAYIRNAKRLIVKRGCNGTHKKGT